MLKNTQENIIKRKNPKNTHHMKFSYTHSLSQTKYLSISFQLYSFRGIALTHYVCDKKDCDGKTNGYI